jgi:ABC-type amino acid transport substrate-binding protein
MLKPLHLLSAVCVAAVLLPAIPAQCAELTGTLKSIQARKAIRIGFARDAYPMSFLADSGEAQGYSIDLCRHIAEAAGKAVGVDPLKIEYVPVTLDERFDAVASGKIDIECATSTITLSRQEKVDFTSMSFVDGGSLLVKKGSAIRNVASLVDETVAVIPGTTSDTALRAALAKSYVNAKVMPVKDHPEGLAAVESGKATAYASDRVLLVGLLAQSHRPGDFEMAPGQFSYEPYGFVVRRGDADFRLLANRTLARLYRSEEIVRIFDKWFGKLGKPGDVLVLMYALNALPE